MTKNKQLIISLFIFLVLLVSVVRYLLNPKVTSDPTLEGISAETIENTDSPTQEPIQEIATNLEIPWEIVFLPDESLLVTQRPGSLVHILSDSKKVLPISGVEHKGEGGLLGLALHPDFETNNWVYLYLTSKEGTGLINRVERYTFNATTNTLSQKTTILDKIPGAMYHDGGEIAFGPDGYLYITTGDAGDDKSAQDTNSLAGKILRITDTGTIPQDNPFGNAVYSYGHRNPQGLAWDATGSLWATEHGPSVTTTGLDEVNRIEMGKNYGWPTITGNKTQSGMVSPKIQSGSETTWAPAGLAIIDNTLFFTGLKGEGLYSAVIKDKELTQLTKHFSTEFGRLRALTLSPDEKWLYISTSNTDGRGSAKENDDKIIKINLDVFNSILQ
ncbi:PQQ-dependent sugar dehydrogenase [Candidatus Woesebacteria bacterium]|nr:PQQ-dependent sugar dehydrogenase [Candidatus Woesebacteria bacterium]